VEEALHRRGAAPNLVAFPKRGELFALAQQVLDHFVRLGVVGGTTVNGS